MYEKSDKELVEGCITEYWRVDKVKESNVRTFNITHNMELAKLDRRIRAAIDEALKQDHTQLAAAEIVGVLECVKLQFLLEDSL